MKAPDPRRRSQSNDGHRSGAAHVLPAIHNAALLASCVEEFKRRASRVFYGPKPAGAGGKPYLTDEQVLELRRMRDWQGLSVRAIAVETGLPLGTVESIVSYRSRVHLDPGPRPVKAA